MSVILDVATSKGSTKKPPVYLIGFSFMPAQEFHIERAGARYGTAGLVYAGGISKTPQGTPKSR